MEYIVYCYNVPAPDKERIVRSFREHAELQLIDIRSLAGLKKIYSDEIAGQVFLAFSGDKVTQILPVIRDIHGAFPGLPMVCVGEGLKPGDIALIRETGMVNYLEREQLDSLYEVVRHIWEKKLGQEVTEKEVLQQYEFLLDVSDSYLSMIGRNYTYLAINDAFSRAHNLKKQELIGNTPVKLWGEETFNKVIKPYLDQSFSKKDIQYRAWFEVPGRGKRFFEVMFRPHVNEEGEVDYVVVSSRDITTEEKAKEQIRKHNEDINLLNLIHQMSNDNLPLEQIVKTLSAQMLDLFEAFTCNIYFHDDRSVSLRPVRFGIREDDYSKVKSILGADIRKMSAGFDKKSFLYRIAKGNKTVQVTEEKMIRKIIYEVGNRSSRIRERIQAFRDEIPVKTVLIVPLSYRSEKLGLMFLSRFSKFTPSEIARINRLAHQISLVLKHDKEDRQFKEQSEKIRLLYETAQDAVIIMDREYLQECNPAAMKMFGIKKKDFNVKTVLDFSPPQQPGGVDSKVLAAKYIGKVLEGIPQTFEWVHLSPSGKPFFALVKLNRLPLNDKYFIQAVVRDIDEEKKNRVRLEESEKSLREAQHIAMLGDWNWDIGNGKVRWSDEFFRILGFDPVRDVPSLRLLIHRIHPDDQRRVLRKIIHATKDCKKCEDQFRVQLPDGTIKYIKSSGVLEKKKGGNTWWHGVIQDITGLVEAENALRESENRFRTIFTESFFAMSLLTGKGDFIDVNKACSKLFGYSGRELRKMKCEQLVPEDDRKNVKELFGQLREGKIDTYTGEKRYLRKDGSVVWTQTGITAIRDKDGSLQHLVTTLVNITGRKQAEMKILRQSRELNLINRMNMELNRGKPMQDILKMMTDSLREQFPVDNLMIFLKDTPGNKVELKMVYLSFPETLLHDVESHWGRLANPPSFTEESSVFLKKVIKKNGPVIFSDQEELSYGVEKLLKSAGIELKGKEFTKFIKLRSITYYPILKDKKIYGAILLLSSKVLDKSILPPISRLMEQTSVIILKKLNEDENQRLYTAIEHMNEMLIISDKTGKILYVNEAFEKIIGTEKNRIIGTNTRGLRNPDVDVSVYHNIWNTVLAGKVWTGKLSMKNKAGEEIPVYYHITPIKDTEGEVVYFVTVIRDISQEMALERYMQRSQKLEMIGRFAGGLAHDFNNILATMLGYTDMVMEEADRKSREYGYLAKIKASGMKAQEIIRQLLTFNRGIEPEKEMINPLRILKESLDLMDTQIPRKITVDFRQKGTIPKIHADPVRLRQVFLNLISNAVHAVEAKKEKNGTIRIEIKKVLADQQLRNKVPDLTPGRYLQILIQDNGTGIDKEVQDKIFEPFFTTKPVGKGSGMGLSVVHGIIKNHDGAIHVESQPGKGSSFLIYLPVT